MAIQGTNTTFQVVQTNKQGLNNTDITNGAVYFVSDTKQLCFDYGSTRTFIEDIVVLNNDSDRTSILFAPLNKFYFCLDTSKLYLYKDGTWYTLNSSATVMTGADGIHAGTSGLVPQPLATDNTKFLKGDGTWSTVDSLPSQTSQSGKFLTTNGTTASWADTPTEIPTQTGNNGKFLTTNGTNVSWASVPSVTFRAWS